MVWTLSNTFASNDTSISLFHAKRKATSQPHDNARVFSRTDIAIKWILDSGALHCNSFSNTPTDYNFTISQRQWSVNNAMICNLICLMWGFSIYSGLSSFRVMDIWTTNQKKMDFMFERCGRQIENVWEMYVADRWLQSKLDSAAYQRVVDLCNIGKTT